MLNITLSVLSISNLYSFSPLFYFKQNNAIFSYLNIQNSFSTTIITECSIFITNSKFKNILSSSIKLLSSKADTIFTETQTIDNIQSSLFDRCKSKSSGGGIYCKNSKLTVTNSLFAYCEASEKGGAIYASLDDKKQDITIQNTRTSFCSAPEGSSFYIYNTNKIILTNSEIEESSPSRRSGIESNCFITTTSDQIEEVNFTSCYSQLSSAALLLDCSESQIIKFATFQGCNGYNILCLKGICYSSQSTIEKVVMLDNDLNGIDNSIGNDRHDGNSIICVMGEWKISDSFFIVNTTNLVSGGFGTVTFFRCTFNIAQERFESNHNAIFLEYIYQENVTLPSYSFNANDIEYTGQYYQSETHRIDAQPPKAKFILKNRIGYIVSAIILTIVFLIITILACNLLKKHRSHVLVLLHETYAAEAQNSDDENINDKINDKDLVIVVDENDKKKNEMKKRDLENDFDDFYHLTRKDNRLQFENVEVPDTHLWDTDEGDAQVADDDAFLVDVNDIIDGFKPNIKSKKGKKKKKKNKH